jgi:hypothetical protein
MQIFINGKPINSQSISLPALVGGVDGSGASYFSIALIANLMNLGHEVLFFCKALPGVELLSTMTDSMNAEIIEPGEKSKFKDTLKGKNISNKIIFVKNIEDILDEESLEEIKKAKCYILSGDVDKCECIDSGEEFISKIFFSESEKFNISLSNAEPYTGLITSTELNGQISVAK